MAQLTPSFTFSADVLGAQGEHGASPLERQRVHHARVRRGRPAHRHDCRYRAAAATLAPLTPRAGVRGGGPSRNPRRATRRQHADQRLREPHLQVLRDAEQLRLLLQIGHL